jgi:hypothetical protein
VEYGGGEKVPQPWQPGTCHPHYCCAGEGCPSRRVSGAGSTSREGGVRGEKSAFPHQADSIVSNRPGVVAHV